MYGQEDVIRQRGLLKERALTLSALAAMKGCCALFDPCTEANLMSLSFQGADIFLDWLGWEANNECVIKKGFIDWVRPDQDSGHCTTGYVEDPCADPEGVDFGVCKFELRDFGRLRRQGPVRDITTDEMINCANEPRWRWDGALITDQMEYDMRLAMEVILQDLRRMTISGNHAVKGQFDGLQMSIKTNYTDPDGRRCATMDSTIIDWNSNDLNGTGGTGVITWNGVAQPAGYTLIDYLLAVYQRLRQRIRWAPVLAAQTMMVGDVVLVLPESFIPCLLDAYTCWSVCPGKQYNEVNLNVYEARNYRRTLDGGMFGFGRIWLDGQEVPLIGYDWNTITGPTTFDLYMLTGKVGNARVLNGQYLDLGAAPGRHDGTFASSDGGRFLTWEETENTCYKRKVEMRPRILNWAPWAQTRFQDIRCRVLGGPLGPDPCESSFFPETSFNSASCPPAS